MHFANQGDGFHTWAELFNSVGFCNTGF